MYLGKIVEVGDQAEVLLRPSHPYTQALLSALPTPDREGRGEGGRIILSGELPRPTNPPSGCRFRTRCWKAQPRCAAEEPELIDRGTGHPAACHFVDLPVTGLIAREGGNGTASSQKDLGLWRNLRTSHELQPLPTP
jgi:oligopeptide transport system ATP-binding protein